MWTILTIILSYLTGSIPTSIIAGKITRGIDIRDHGSKNPGATNTFRVLGKKIGITVGLIDIFKGFFCVAVIAAALPVDDAVSHELRAVLAGMSAIAGHVWTVFAGFRGGKGVGTAFGVFIALAPVPSMIALVTWITLTFSTGYVSVGSIAAAVALPVSVIALGIAGDDFPVLTAGISVIVGLLVVIRHRTNIGRLMRGEENRFGKRVKS